ncbi:hypothetical protein EW145_g6883 [Phellinidium pouzarii]|uniref:Uncharacterized protein n=1 Tax=Phellinidium pouzarii TaxID=167371 RepID=A0A4S4KSG0_9AGAM|nr:hypothetical protein EW145_g6883 [Phellinidium pouzarii]
MEAHNPGQPGYDSRSPYVSNSSERIWGACLHPKLRSAASMLHIMARYYEAQWVYWRKELDDDHAHEMMTRVLLDHIVRIEENNSEVKIDLKKQRIDQNASNKIYFRENGTAISSHSFGIASSGWPTKRVLAADQ